MRRYFMTNEKLEQLGNGISVIVSDEHKFSTDTLLLADFACPKKYEKAAEFGTGCGTIPLFWHTKTPPKFTTAIEIQENAFNLAKRSVELNNLSDRIEVVHSDIKNYDLKNYKHSYDLVVCNPPYKAVGRGLLNDSVHKKIARHELVCSTDDVVKVAEKFLNFGGRLCICQRSERLCDVMLSMRNHNIEPKRLRFVQQRRTSLPKLFLLEGKRGRNPGLVVMPVLIIEDDNGNKSDELKKIYEFYMENGENKNDR